MVFDDVLGQSAAKRQISNALHSGRIPHALLIDGPPGAGQLPMAFATARAILSESASSDLPADLTLVPDVHLVLPIYSKQSGGSALTTDDFIGEFRTAMARSPYLDLALWAQHLESGNKQLIIPIHEIRALRHKAQLKTFGGGRKIIIVWRADKMNIESANAFLKLLEEPGDGTVLILTTESGGHMLPTITSRCQRIGLERLSPELVADYLKTTLRVEPERAEEAALLCDGSLTKAIEIVQRAGDTLTESFQFWMRTCYTGKFEDIQGIASEFAKAGKEYQKLFFEFALAKLRASLMLNRGADELALVSASERKFATDFGHLAGPAGLGRMIERVEEARFHVLRNANATMVMTVLSLRLNTILRKHQKQRQTS